MPREIGEPFQIWELWSQGLSRPESWRLPFLHPIPLTRGNPSPGTGAPWSLEPPARHRLPRSSPGPPSRRSTPVSRPRSLPVARDPGLSCNPSGPWVPVPRALRIPSPPPPRCSRKQNPNVGTAPQADRRRSQLGALLARPGSPGRAKGRWWRPRRQRQAAQLCYE